MYHQTLKKSVTHRIALLLAACVCAAISSIAQGSGRYRLLWHTIDGGASQKTSGPYRLISTVGQFDAAPAQITEESLRLSGGVWPDISSCLIDFEDFAHFAAQWLMVGPDLTADLNEDGRVELDDLLLFSQMWLVHCPSGWQL